MADFNLSISIQKLDVDNSDERSVLKLLETERVNINKLPISLELWQSFGGL